MTSVWPLLIAIQPLSERLATDWQMIGD